MLLLSIKPRRSQVQAIVHYLTMSTKYLKTGSVEPPRVKGLLRLYSNTYCPFAERARLVLKAKGIPHDIVDISLIEKPEWYSKIHPEGKVPALLEKDKVIVESLDICDYLDANYPKNPLYPSDLEAKKKDKELIQKLDGLTGVFGKIMYHPEEKTHEEWKKEFLQHLQAFEDELGKRRTTFFGGSQPGMVDYMLWPWSERGEAITLRLGTKLPFDEGDIPHLRKWKEAMLAQPVVAEIAIPSEKFFKVLMAKINGTLDFDNI